MKKIFTTIAMAVLAATGFAQKNQQYLRVEFDVPITGYTLQSGQSNTSVSATMKDDYTYCNPEHEYLDFPAGGNLKAVGTVGEMTFRSTTTNYNEYSSYYLENGRTTWTTAGKTAASKYPYLVDRIKKITAYSLPVEKCELIDSTATHEITFIGDGEKYKVSEFTFNRLPRNVAELKQLVEDANGKRLAACNNPLYVAALMHLVWPRLLDCSQDCREMIDYLYGTQYEALNTVGIANKSFQQVCIAQYGDFKDLGGGWKHYNLFQFFAGATPGNCYKPNGKDYWTGPYKVRVGWYFPEPTAHSSQKNCTIAKLVLMPNPDATSKDDIGFEQPLPRNYTLRSTNNNGWFFESCEVFYGLGKDQQPYSDF